MLVDFVHLTASPLERALPNIAEKALAGGGRVVVVAGDARQRSALDKLLWAYDPESFLPHAQAGGDADGEQPVLIAPDLTAPNGARIAVLADGIWRDEALAFDRAVLFFDDNALAAAREAWRSVRIREGVEPRYWKQNDRGTWTKVA